MSGAPEDTLDVTTTIDVRIVAERVVDEAETLGIETHVFCRHRVGGVA